MTNLRRRTSRIGAIVESLIQRGMTPDQLALELNVTSTNISMIRRAKTMPGDEKLAVLARLHGGYTQDDLIVLKYLDWLETEKGITPDMLTSVMTRLNQTHEAA